MKRILVGICLIILVCFLALGYKGLFPGQAIDLNAEVAKESSFYYSGYLVRMNWLGTAVFEIDIDTKPTNVAAWRGTFMNKIQTHGTMLSLRKGMTLPQMIAAVGVPDGVIGAGIDRLAYKTLDGYTYAIRLENTTAGSAYDVHKIALRSVMVFTPEGDWMSVEDTAAFRWRVRLVYIAIAAVLIAILVCLLRIPRIIEKRKAKSANPIPKE